MMIMMRIFFLLLLVSHLIIFIDSSFQGFKYFFFARKKITSKIFQMNRFSSLLLDYLIVLASIVFCPIVIGLICFVEENHFKIIISTMTIMIMMIIMNRNLFVRILFITVKNELRMRKKQRRKST